MTDEELKQLVAANAKAIGELRDSIGEVRESMRESIGELRDSIGEVRDSMRESIGELRESIGEVRASTGDMRASINSLRDIVAGHERRIIRLEGKEIDTWGDYITLLDRVRALEEWKRKLQGESDQGAGN
jgi:Mg2+ and Co2+ transporter CorA